MDRRRRVCDSEMRSREFDAENAEPGPCRGNSTTRPTGPKECQPNFEMGRDEETREDTRGDKRFRQMVMSLQANTE